MVVLVDAGPGAGALEPAAAEQLAALGVTGVSVVHDDVGTGVVLEGWAFDPADAGDEAAAIVAGNRKCVRRLHPLLESRVSTERRKR
jgi:hypothetical protein